MNENWKPAYVAPEGIVLLTKVDDAKGVRNVQRLVRKGPLWYHPDMSVYVYYTPTHYAHES